MSREAWDHEVPESPDRTADRPTAREPQGRRIALPEDGLALPRTDQREAVVHRDRVYHLRGSETRLLVPVGVFRVVPAVDLADGRSAPDACREDLRRLANQGLIERRTIPINHQPTPVVVLTREGKALLDGRRRDRHEGRRQQYHAGFVKPRELGHDAQLYRLYQAEARRLGDEGARITRIVLDYELKRDYQIFRNRRDRPDDESAEEARRTFAAASRLPVIEGHLELPDLRLEFETEDGRLDVRDVELVTEHYSRGQLAGKARAGFARYRAAGVGGRRGGSARTGGTPTDPHHLERLL